MSRIRGFPPIESPSSRLLILGSMPGRLSLATGQYYAHPQNAFWSIMGALVGAGPDLPYPVRADILKSAGVAVWDVLESCERKGSLDTDIHPKSIKANVFRPFYASHPDITHVFFNGTMAEASYRRHVMATVGDIPIKYIRLPSTSPANASSTKMQKLAMWRQAFEGCGVPAKTV